MKSRTLMGLVSFFTIVIPGMLCGGGDPELRGMKEATTPSPRYKPNAKKQVFWHRYYNGKRKQTEKSGKDIQILFIGDSITRFWDVSDNGGKRGGGIKTRDKYFKNYNTLNLGYSGDRTGNTLWVVKESGLLDNISPKLAVVMIGTNNIGHRRSGVKAAAAGVKAIIDVIREKLPETKILLFGIFPRQKSSTHPYSVATGKINSIIKDFADNNNVFYCDISDKLRGEDGELSPEIMPDYLHPNENGYEIWAQAIMPYVERFVDGK